MITEHRSDYRGFIFVTTMSLVILSCDPVSRPSSVTHGGSIAPPSQELCDDTENLQLSDCAAEVDTSAPSLLESLTPVSGANLLRRRVDLAGKCEPLATIHVSGDLVADHLSAVCSDTGSFTMSLTATAGAGSKSFEIKQIDEAGNQSPTTILTFNLITSPLAYVVSNADQKLFLVKVTDSGAFEVEKSRPDWSFGESVLLLPSNQEPTHALFHSRSGAGKFLHLFKLNDSGMPDEAPLASLEAEADEYRDVFEGGKAGKLIAIQRKFGTSQRIENINYDLTAGTMVKESVFFNVNTVPEYAAKWKDKFLYILDHFAHGIGVYDLLESGAVAAAQSSFYEVCSGTGLCNGGYPAGQVITHPVAPRLYEVSYYHGKGVTSAINEATGALSHISTFDTKNKPWHITLHPSSKWIFIGHIFEASYGAYLQVFAVDPISGDLIPTPIYESDIGFTVVPVFNADGSIMYLSNGTEKVYFSVVNAVTGIPGALNFTVLPATSTARPHFFSKVLE